MIKKYDAIDEPGREINKKVLVWFKQDSSFPPNFKHLLQLINPFLAFDDVD